MSFATICDTLEAALGGRFRATVVRELSTSPTLAGALQRLREALRSDVWSFGEASLTLALAVREYDRKTRDDGFHALHDWDGVAVHVNPETIPVDVLDYIARQRAEDPFEPVAPAILIDYYFMHVLSLLSLRLWDDGDADANLDRLEGLLRMMQGPGGSGQRFCADAETLILIATAHYEREEWGYDGLLARVRTLNQRHRARIALGHATAMGCHLRFGFEATYGRDTSLMRNDNVADYPWLCFSLATLMDEYCLIRDGAGAVVGRRALVEAMLNGMTADPRAFLGSGPASLAAHEVERGRFRERFQSYEPDLVDEFEAFRPSAGAYSPLSFFFNFSHNVMKGQIVDSLLWSLPWPVGLNDLFTSELRDEDPERSREQLARTLTAYARTNPQTIRGRLMPVIVYDPEAGYRSFRLTLRRLRE
jgi:hypothetical protein